MQSAALGYGASEEATALLNLPTLVSHMHDYFVHVAARLEKLHHEVRRAQPPNPIPRGRQRAVGRL